MQQGKKTISTILDFLEYLAFRVLSFAGTYPALMFLLSATLFLAVVRQPKTIRVNEKYIKVYIFVKTIVAR